MLEDIIMDLLDECNGAYRGDVVIAVATMYDYETEEVEEAIDRLQADGRLEIEKAEVD